jgi:hypothetical protein
MSIDRHYLNLPVVETDGRLVDIVDVLKLTYATLEQVRIYSFMCLSIPSDNLWFKLTDERYGRRECS